MGKLSKLGFLLMLVLAMFLAACGSNEPESNAANGESGGKEKKTLRIVTDGAYAPMEYMDGGKVVGFGVDFAKAIVAEAGYEPNIEVIGWDPIFAEIEGKTADMAVSSITINDERKETYDFSVPYYLSTNKILVPKDSDVASGADLKGKKIAVLNGSTGQEVAEKIVGENSRDILKFADNNLAIQELLAGGADAVIADNTIVEYYTKMNPEQNLKAVEDDSFADEFYGVLFPKGSDLKPEIDEAINAVFESGKYAEIYEQWFGAQPDIETLKAQQ
ncbi:transporter substrate-binding domain-containing protein [Planomicrobium chinense]|uniref:transporter substrate-binding domain-containing protein n=1 Tax=Planococcus chinensis TaxID=272917 RepID=UPI001CC41DB2|nr:transporter substrate-binding domain-containing protein [Planococcus chinensis]MBZ5200656.1 transporter substrate-binding domain-containing protein [Planococcus chinensis]